MSYGVIGMLDFIREPRAEDGVALSFAFGVDAAPFCPDALAELASSSFRNWSLFILKGRFSFQRLRAKGWVGLNKRRREEEICEGPSWTFDMYLGNGSESISISERQTRVSINFGSGMVWTRDIIP